MKKHENTGLEELRMKFRNILLHSDLEPYRNGHDIYALPQHVLVDALIGVLKRYRDFEKDSKKENL